MFDLVVRRKETKDSVFEEKFPDAEPTTAVAMLEELNAERDKSRNSLLISHLFYIISKIGGVVVKF